MFAAPLQRLGQFDDFVIRTVDKQGFADIGDVRRGHGIMRDGGANQQQQVGRALLGSKGGDIAAERESRNRQLRRVRVLRARMVDHADNVIGFAAPVVVFAFAVARAAQVGQVAVETHLGQGFGGGLNDFVGERAALRGVGVVNDGHAAFGVLGGQIQRFQLPRAALDEENVLFVQHGFVG